MMHAHILTSSPLQNSDCAMTELCDTVQACHFVAKCATMQSVCGLAGKVLVFGDDFRVKVTIDEQQRTMAPTGRLNETASVSTFLQLNGN